MDHETIVEVGRVLFHLNGYTKVLLERTEGLGIADGGIVWEISTELIPMPLRKIGSRFIVRYKPLNAEEMNNLEAIRGAKYRIEILEMNDQVSFS